MSLVYIACSHGRRPVVVPFGLPISTAVAAEPGPLVREIFVPFKDLDAILESQAHRVMLPREQYEDLLKKAKTNPETHAPQAAALLGAEYAGTIEEERARWTGRLAIEVLEDGLHVLPLELRTCRCGAPPWTASRRPSAARATGAGAPGRRPRPARAGAGDGLAAGDDRRPAVAQVPPALSGRGEVSSHRARRR